LWSPLIPLIPLVLVLVLVLALARQPRSVAMDDVAAAPAEGRLELSAGLPGRRCN
jgi:hypothetical protein